VQFVCYVGCLIVGLRAQPHRVSPPRAARPDR
jgi:hypothetical protein